MRYFQNFLFLFNVEPPQMIFFLIWPFDIMNVNIYKLNIWKNKKLAAFKCFFSIFLKFPDKINTRYKSLLNYHLKNYKIYCSIYTIPYKNILEISGKCRAKFNLDTMFNNFSLLITCRKLKTGGSLCINNSCLNLKTWVLLEQIFTKSLPE